MGHSRPGRADGKSGHVRYPPIATGFCGAAKFRNVPIPDLAHGGRRPLSALATIVSKRRELTVAQSRYCGSRPHSALLGLSQQILRHKNLVVVATVLL